jgi:O-methyltransferase
LEHEVFAFDMLDVDLFNPTISGLGFFYDRVNSGGYIFIHDYNSPESDWAVLRATNEFMKDKPEKMIEIPDMGGSVIFRKM